MKPVELEIIMRDSTRQGMQSVTGNMTVLEKCIQNNTLMLRQLEKALKEMQTQFAGSTKTIADQTENIAMVEALKNEIEELKAKLIELEQVKKKGAGAPIVAPGAPRAAASSFNGLGMSIQQVARELPSLTMGANMFFLAISNNLPILADNLKVARTEYDLLKKTNQAATPVWKQVVSSIFSWQTAMVVGITLLTVYGKDILEWTVGLFKNKEAIDQNRASIESLSQARLKGAQSAQTELARLKLLYQATQSDALGKKEQLKAIKELQDKYPNYFGNLSSEEILAGNAAKAYKNLTAAIIESAKARAYEDKIVENEKKILELDSKRMGALVNETKAKQRLNKANTTLENLEGNPEAYDFQLTAVNKARDKMNEYGSEAKRTADEIAGLQKANEKLAGKIKPSDLLFDYKPPKESKGDSLSIDNLSDANLKARQKIDDMYLSLMAEGAEKERAQAAHDFELEKQRIKKEETERLALYESLKKAGAKVDPNQPQIIHRQAESQKVLAGVDYDNKIDGINEKETQGKRDNLEKLLKPYRDFARQRIIIEKQYDADIEQLQKEKDNAKGDAGKEQLISDSIVVAEEEKANALAELDRVFAEKDVYFQTLMSRLGAMSLEELQKALANAEKALQSSQLSGGKNSKETVVARAKVAALKNEIKVAKAENETEAPDDLAKWKKTSDSIKKCKGEIDNMIDSMDFLDESTKVALQTASNVAGGAIAMIDGIKTLSVTAGESISAVEKASVILAIVGAAIQIMTAIFSMASASEERHQKALKEIADAKLAMQREYNLLLLQQNLLMKEATTIFGEKEIAKAANAIAVYKEAIKQYKEELKGEVPTFKLTSLNINNSLSDYKKQKAAYDKGVGALNNVEIKTGHKKTGLFGWGKGKDIYSSVLSVYPDLIDAENKLNVERAKSIISTQTMSDENKNLLQNLIDLQEQAEEAQEALRDYLQDTFGGLGDGIMESITDAIQTGNDAWESFGNKGAEVLEDLGKQIAYSLFFADKFKNLQKELEAVYGTGKSEEDIAKDAMNLLGNFYANIGKDMDLAQDFMKNWQEEAAKKGFDLWKPEETEQSGKAGALTTITQDQGMKLEGLFTSVQRHVSDIDDAVKDIVMAMYEAADMLAQIVANTSHCKHLEQMAEDIAELKRDGFKMK